MTAETPNYYAVLGVDQQATAAQIKAAYRHKVKTAHPDTGGSAEAMQRLTAAYEALSDPLVRRAYDASRQKPTPQAQAPRQNQSEPESRSYRAADPDPPAAAHSRAQAEAHATLDHHHNMANTRRYVWRQVEEFGLLALISGVGLSFVSFWLTTTSGQIIAGITGFVPLYWLILQLIYLAVPELKLNNYFTMRHPLKAERQERLVLFATVLLWLPMGIVWAIGLRLLFPAS